MTIRQEMLSVEDATNIAASGFIQNYNPSLENDVRLHLGIGTTYTVYEDERKVGFVIYELFGDILYISGIVLLSSAQGNGYARRIIDQLCKEVGLPFLGYRTQSPRMWSVGMKLCKEWYPNPTHTPNVDTLAKIKFLCQRINTPSYPVSKGFYGHALYGCKPILRDNGVQRWWDDMCSFEAGDSVVCFGIL
jgi:hypothetical protein